jgi:hypothetical protein
LFNNGSLTFSDTLLNHFFNLFSIEIEGVVSVRELFRRLDDVTPVNSWVEVLAFNEVSS